MHADDLQLYAWTQVATFEYGTGDFKIVAAAACLSAGKNGVAIGAWTSDHWYCADRNGSYFALMVWH